MANKELQRKRMIGYFVDAACKIIDEEGIEQVTARKVADLAGYNSATLYNYFENLDHLILFSSLRYLKEYAADLPKWLKKAKDPLQTYLNIWRCFSLHSYQRPFFYHQIFFGGYDYRQINEYITSYYSMFQEDLGEDVKKYLPMFLEENIYQRDYVALKDAVAAGILLEEDIRKINEMNVLIYQGMLDRMMHNVEAIQPEQAVEKTLSYIKRTLMAFGISKDTLDQI